MTRSVDIDGTGAGYGKYRGLKVSEIKERFAQCVADPSMRSISAVLRITREQIESRGQLGVYPVLALIGLACLIITGAMIPFFPPDARAALQKVAIGIAAGTLIMGMGAMKVRQDRRVNLAQENAIREAAVVALREILATAPTLKPLTREQRDTVKELIKKRKAPDLAVLLQKTE